MLPEYPPNDTYLESPLLRSKASPWILHKKFIRVPFLRLGFQMTALGGTSEDKLVTATLLCKSTANHHGLLSVE